MAAFEPALAYVGINEGGYANNPADKGGETMYGITEALARRYGYAGPMRELPKAVADSIYREEFWRFDGVASQAVATKLLDLVVNFGMGGGVTVAQKAVNDLVEPQVAVDGGWGPDTLDAINTADPAELLEALSQRAAERYKAIVDRDPSQSVFLSGWLKRAMRNPAIVGGTSLALLIALGVGAWMFWGRR